MNDVITIDEPTNKEKSYWHYYWKAFKWFIGNLLFGLVPILILLLVVGLSNGSTGADGVFLLMHEGVIHFLCIALMGAVMTESLLSGVSSRGTEIFAVYIFPIIILSFVSLEYLLVYLHTIKNECFDATSGYTIIVLSLSFGYCTFIKTSFYIRELTKKILI